MVGYGGKDLQKRKVLSLEWKSEEVMDDDSSESMEPMEGSATHTSWWGRIGEISAQLTWLMDGSRELIPETRGSILEVKRPLYDAYIMLCGRVILSNAELGDYGL